MWFTLYPGFYIKPISLLSHITNLMYVHPQTTGWVVVGPTTPDQCGQNTDYHNSKSATYLEVVWGICPSSPKHPSQDSHSEMMRDSEGQRYTHHRPQSANQHSSKWDRVVLNITYSCKTPSSIITLNFSLPSSVGTRSYSPIFPDMNRFFIMAVKLTLTAPVKHSTIE